MSSIMTNVSAMTALKSLNATNAALATTQSRISTGFKVAEAKDNAAYWSIATTMRSDNKALSTVQDALGLGAAKVDTAYTGMNAAIEVVDEIKKKLVAAREGGVDRAKVQAEISTLQEQLKSNSAAASFSGENWLSVDSSAEGYGATKQIVSSFTRSGDGVSVGTVNVDTAKIALFNGAEKAATGGDTVGGGNAGILDARYGYGTAGDPGDPDADPVVPATPGTAGGTRLADQTEADSFSVADLDISSLTNSADDLAKLDAMISGVDDALKHMAAGAADLGAASKRIDMQKTFVGNLMNTIEKGVGTLVDADMNQESTKLQALQVQQQLGIQALSIANGSAQQILSLFR